MINELEEKARKLNAASDKLCGIINELNTKLKKLNLGIEKWVSQPNDGYVWLGYAIVNRKWGLAIRIESAAGTDEWIFNEAPRMHRIRAIGLLNTLLIALRQEAESLTEKIQKTNEPLIQFLKNLK